MKYIIVFIVALIFLLGCNSITQNDTTTAQPKENVCQVICHSHNYSYIKEDGGGYHNYVCYCVDQSQQIWTFVDG